MQGDLDWGFCALAISN